MFLKKMLGERTQATKKAVCFEKKSCEREKRKTMMEGQTCTKYKRRGIL
jgi:hypothetical protein